MTLHMKPEGIDAPPAQTTAYILGMPHLCPSGLSENWLWKELGHRHWDLIAREIGRGTEGFGATEGQPTYAASAGSNCAVATLAPFEKMLSWT